MSLSERLAEAAAARRSGAATTSTRATRSPAPAETDLLDPGSAVDSGLPAPCPDCGGAGFLEHIDLATRRQHERCRACGTRWSRPV